MAIHQAAGGTVRASSPSYEDVRAAIASAKEGDTVAVPPGVGVWGKKPMTVVKAITVQGAGIGRTILQEDFQSDKPLLSFDTEKGKFYR